MNISYPQNSKNSLDRQEVSCLLFSASLREGSLNSELARLASKVITDLGGTVDIAEMSDFDCASYNQDDQDRLGFPKGAEEFRRRLILNDAFVISSPEYNFSIPGVLKNAIDWVSRYKPQPFNLKHALLLSASPSMAGGNRGLWSLRIPLEHLGARVFPDMFSLAQAGNAFNSDGFIQNIQLQKRFEQTITAFMDLVEADKHYAYIKKAWFEFLGEKPSSDTERAE
ncbi:NADPH-dependent FMN reductase [Chitinispirillum alkaliphilum]|nr:NADPH-dependent FMN reductase [Chitinispirillum alkaliphilum]